MFLTVVGATLLALLVPGLLADPPAGADEAGSDAMIAWLLASGIGVLTATGVWLLLRARTFDVPLGLTLLSYAVNLFIFVMGRVAFGAPPIIRDGVPATLAHYADPLPQALVLTAIVISFAMTALLLALALKARFVNGSDLCDAEPSDETPAIDLRRAGTGRRGAGRSAAMTGLGAHLLVLPIVLPLAAGAALLVVERRWPRAQGALGSRRPSRWLVAPSRCCGAPMPATSASTCSATGRRRSASSLVLDRLSALLVALTAAAGAAGGGLRRARAGRGRGPHFHAFFQFQLAGLGGAFLTARPLQPVRVLRGAADRLVRAAAARRRRAARCAAAITTWSSTWPGRRCS